MIAPAGLRLVLVMIADLHDHMILQEAAALLQVIPQALLVEAAEVVAVAEEGEVHLHALVETSYKIYWKV